MTYSHPDMVDKVYGTLSSDATLKAITGLTIEKTVNRKALATGGNCKRVFISKNRSNRVEWNAGGKAGQLREYVKIETVVRMTDETALSEINTITNRIRNVLSPSSYLGTNWLQHTLVQDVFPSAPTKTHAYHFFIFETMISVGVS